MLGLAVRVIKGKLLLGSGLSRVRAGVRVRVRSSFGRVRLRLRLRLEGGVVGSVLVATPGSVHSTCVELQLLIIPQRHMHILPRPLLFRRYKPTKK